MARLVISGQEHDCVWLHVQLNDMPAGVRSQAESKHKESGGHRELSISVAQDGSGEAVIKVLGWDKTRAPTHRSIIAVYGPEDLETVRGIVWRAGWQPDDDL